MDIHGEDSFGLSRENPLLFRANHMHQLYFNDFTVPSSKTLKEFEDIDAMTKHVIMKGLNDDEPNSPPSSLTPPRHTSTSLDYPEPSLKLEEDDELGSTFAFFRKPGTHSNLSHSVDDLLPQHHHNNSNNRHDFAFLQPFELGRGKPKDSSHSSPNGVHGPPLHHNAYGNLNHHDSSNKNSDSVILSPTTSNSNTTIINNINTINNISNISTVNNIHNISNINNYNTINTINNSINISININSNNLPDTHHSKDLSDPNVDDKSAIQLINNTNNGNLEFLDDYITTGSNSSPDECSLDQDDDMDGLDDSSASLNTTLASPAINNTPVLVSPVAPSTSIQRTNTLPHSNALSLNSSLALNTSHITHNSSSTHQSTNRLHHSTSSLIVSSNSNSSVVSVIPSTEGYHSLSSSCNMVIKDSESCNGNVGASAGAVTDGHTPIVLAPGGTTVIDGVTYNNRGYEVCGSLNKFNKPCQRIGRCPFHHDSSSPKKSVSSDPSNTSTPTPERRFLPIKKGPYKSGWKKDEHIRFLKGLQMHGKGSWKEIALIVGTRTPTQIQVHAHRYYLRQQQETKNKRSIHDISLHDLEELEGHGPVAQPSLSESTGTTSQLSPPSPDRNSDLSHLFCFSPNHSSSPSPTPSASSPSAHAHTNTSHLTANPLSSSAPPVLPPLPSHPPNPLSHSDGAPPSSTPASSPPISAPSSPIAPSLSSSSFPPLFSTSTTTSSLSNTLPGLPLLSFPLASLNYHSSSWYSAPYSLNQMSNLNSMTINMSSLGDVDLHLPPPSEHKLMSPLPSSFSHMSDDDYEDDLGSHHPSTHPSHHSDPSSPEEEFPSDDD